MFIVMMIIACFVIVLSAGFWAGYAAGKKEERRRILGLIIAALDNVFNPTLLKIESHILSGDHSIDVNWQEWALECTNRRGV